MCKRICGNLWATAAKLAPILELEAALARCAVTAGLEGLVPVVPVKQVMEQKADIIRKIRYQAYCRPMLDQVLSRFELSSEPVQASDEPVCYFWFRLANFIRQRNRLPRRPQPASFPAPHRRGRFDWRRSVA